MTKCFGATFSGPDMVAVTRALIEAAPYARATPAEMRRKMVPVEVTNDWLERMLAPDVEDLSVSWRDREYVSRGPGAVAAGFPAIPIDPQKVLEFVAPLPFELAVMPPVHMWMDDYFAPAIGADHALLGWGAILRGRGHERSVVSRRWIERGPWRLFRGPNDTTLIQFHELEVEAEVSMGQAQAAHAWMVAGFLRPTHRYRHDIAGVYTKEDGLLRIIVNDRAVEDSELLDACAARRDRREDPEGPIRNIAYVFMDEEAARERLDALWLRGLECRTLRKGEEVRLDEGHDVPRPEGWW